ncbi:hypothetical protein BDZ89DRAFT_1116745 [Hymenopellis radicata]|nr:hypothetical protein BDZ89DRAFT_1116745 [Hymenopellis radicata]
MSTASQYPRGAPDEYLHVLSFRNNDSGPSSAVQPPPKRVKTKHQSKSKQTQESRMGPLGKLPVELILEILSHLTPKSLFAIMFLCRTFCDILSDPSGRLWKAARSNERIPMPAPPPDLTELQWAKFLWNRYCEVCGPGASKKLTNLYSLRKRICVKCMSANLIYQNTLSKNIPFASMELLLLVVPSDKNKHGNCLLRTAARRDNTDNRIVEADQLYYWKFDITSMFRQVSRDHPEVVFGCAGAASASAARDYEAFVKETTAHIQRRLQHAYECCEWDRKMYLLAKQDQDDASCAISATT